MFSVEDGEGEGEGGQRHGFELAIKLNYRVVFFFKNYYVYEI